MGIWSLGQEDALDKEMATHFRILAWKIPWTEEPGGLQSMGSQKRQTQLSAWTTTSVAALKTIPKFSSLKEQSFLAHSLQFHRLGRIIPQLYMASTGIADCPENSLPTGLPHEAGSSVETVGWARSLVIVCAGLSRQLLRLPHSMAFRYKREEVETACFLKRQAQSGMPSASAGS